MLDRVTPTREVDAIDTSHYNAVDFDALPKLALYITKATQGTSRVDPKFVDYRDEARRVGIPKRVWYHFVTGDDAETQARFFAATIGALQPGEGVMLDVEPDLAHGVGTLHWDHITSVAEAIIRFTHVPKVIVYVGLYYPGAPPPPQYPWILPHYGNPNWGTMPRSPMGWQWSSTHHVAGVAGNCDVNTILDMAELGSALMPGGPPPAPSGGNDVINFVQLDDTHPPTEHDPVFLSSNTATLTWMESQEAWAAHLTALGWPTDPLPPVHQCANRADLAVWGALVAPFPPGWVA